MPFTPSHAVVALPFVRTPLVPAAIAVGAMAPDLPLFLRLGTRGSSMTHSFAWVPLTVILALGLLLVWRLVLRPAARELLPDPVARRLPTAWEQPASATLRETFVGPKPGRAWATAGALLVSLLLGVLSHLVWDGFTHEDRFGSDLIPVIGRTWGDIAGTVWLQNASSGFGLLVLAACALVWFRRASVGERPHRRLPRSLRGAVWIALPVLLAVATVIGVVISWHPPFDAAWAECVAYRAMPPAVAIWGALLVTACAATVVRRARSAPSAAG